MPAGPVHLQIPRARQASASAQARPLQRYGRRRGQIVEQEEICIRLLMAWLIDLKLTFISLHRINHVGAHWCDLLHYYS